MYWDLSAAASRERGESWGRRRGRQCVVGGGWRVCVVGGGCRVCVVGGGYSAVNMFLPGLRSWWNLLACCY